MEVPTTYKTFFSGLCMRVPLIWITSSSILSYPICSMYGIFTYMTGRFLGQMLVNIPYMEHMGIIILSYYHVLILSYYPVIIVSYYHIIYSILMFVSMLLFRFATFTVVSTINKRTPRCPSFASGNTQGL